MNIQKRILLLQLFATLLVLGFLPGNMAKAATLLAIWIFSFTKLNKTELVLFLLTNVLFVASDISAIQNDFFRFTSPDYFGLPVFEFFMWGFYFLHSHKMLNTNYPTSIELKTVLLATAFSLAFAVVHDHVAILAVTFLILSITLAFHHEPSDLKFLFYFSLLGILIEIVGVKQNLWVYPNRSLTVASLQILIMWSAIGVFMRRLLGPWLVQKQATTKLNLSAHTALHPILEDMNFEAGNLKLQGLHNQAWQKYLKIKAVAREKSLPLNYEFCIDAAQAAIQIGYLREAISLYREALCYVTNNLERAQVHLSLCRTYRILNNPQSARFEIQQAFDKLAIPLPQATLGSLLLSTFKYLKRSAVSNSGLLFALYEELRLSAQEHRDSTTAIQCQLLSRSLERSLQ